MPTSINNWLKWMGFDYIFLSSRYVEETRCLIHNAHLKKIPSFCRILDLKITHLKKIFVFHKRKFSKVTSKMQVSFVNEAPDHSQSSLAFLTRYKILHKLGIFPLSDHCEWGTCSRVSFRHKQMCLNGFNISVVICLHP
jgi:hypothetical protein